VNIQLSSSGIYRSHLYRRKIRLSRRERNGN